MALFTAEDILRNDDIEKTLLLDCFVLPEGADVPTIDIIINDEVRQAAKKAEKKYILPKIFYADTPYATPERDAAGYCEVVLRKAYTGSEGLVEKPTKSLIIKLIHKQPKLAVKVASLLIESLESAELYKDEKDASDEQD